MSAPELRQRVIDWLDDNYHFGEAQNLIKDDEMSFKKTCSLKIDRKSLSRANFDSLGKIVRYVTAHKDYRGVK
jgi:hypothetical protein